MNLDFADQINQLKIETIDYISVNTYISTALYIDVHLT